ncbi:MAG: chromosomal replication initiator protein DnaA [Acidimicrobiia bacterium]|nr:chromosomal replication initiator protein DnaA [Acidimicrobiia bacterium]
MLGSLDLPERNGLAPADFPGGARSPQAADPTSTTALRPFSTRVDVPVDNRGDVVVLDDAAEELWSRVATAVRRQLAEPIWNTWFQGVHVLSLTDEALLLGVPSSVAVERIRSSFLGLLTDAAQALTGVPLAVDLAVDTIPRDDEPVLVGLPAVQPSGSPSTSASPTITQAPPVDEALPYDRSALVPRYTFDQFVIGASNRFAHAAALSVAESPARLYNPLFIYGPAGLGKTHLLHAIGHHVRHLFPSKRVRYVPTETMMNEFVDAMRAKEMPNFKKRYRDVDVLLVDDIQFLERTEQLQEEFFYTFNDLHSRGSQIVISSDRPPKSIATIEDRLRSRFEWGLITDIQRPEFETRLAILRKKADSERLDGIPAEVLAFIATNIIDNVRELEGSLIRVAAYSSLNRVPLTEEVAHTVLADLLPSSRPRVITPELILDETAKMFGWTIDDLCGRSRRRPLVTARQIGMYVFRELTDYSYPKIAEEFGGRDHTTVMHACDKIRTQMAERRVVLDQVNELINRVKLGSSG